MSAFDGSFASLAALAYAAGQAQSRQRRLEQGGGRYVVGPTAPRQSRWQEMMDEQNTILRQAREDRAREQAFALQEAGARRRGTPTRAADAHPAIIAAPTSGVVPLDAGAPPPPSGFVSGPAGVLSVNAEAPSGMRHEIGDDGIELIDPQTGRLDMTRLPTSRSFRPPQPTFARAGQQPEMVDPDTARKVQYVRSLNLPPEWETVARDPKMTMDKLVDDVRQAASGEPAPSRGLNLRDRQIEVQRLKRGMIQAQSQYASPDVIEAYRSRIAEEEQAIRDSFAPLAPQQSHSISRSIPIPDPGVAQPPVIDGPTATNPLTGERIIFRNGQWEPL